MSEFTITSHRPPGAWGFLAAAGILWDTVQKEWAARRTYASLSALDNHALKDIGLDRSEITSIAWARGLDLTRRGR